MRFETRSTRVAMACVVLAALGAALGFVIRQKTVSNDSTISAAAQAASPLSSGATNRTMSHTKAPPTFQSNASSGDVQKDPTAADYDPMRLMKVLMARDVFKQEPRNPVWAAKVEEHLLRGLQEDVKGLLPDGKISVECRTTMCQWSWDGPADKKNQTSVLLRTLYHGSGGSDGDEPNSWAMAYAGGAYEDVPKGDPDALKAKLVNQRAKKLELIHRLHMQKLPHPIYDQVPYDAWPKK